MARRVTGRAVVLVALVLLGACSAAPADTSPEPTATANRPRADPALPADGSVPAVAAVIAPTTTGPATTATEPTTPTGQPDVPMPNPTLTPGAVIATATKETVCVSGYTKTVRNVPSSIRQKVLAEYGIANPRPAHTKSTTSSRSSSAAPTTSPTCGRSRTTTPMSLEVRTGKVAAYLEGEICHDLPATLCSADGRTSGVISLNIADGRVDTDRMTGAGKTTGLWSSADVVRMTKTRALDGTQKTGDGKVSWTFHPNDGLQLVIAVADDTVLPVTTTTTAAPTRPTMKAGPTTSSPPF